MQGDGADERLGTPPPPGGSSLRDVFRIKKENDERKHQHPTR